MEREKHKMLLSKRKTKHLHYIYHMKQKHPRTTEQMCEDWTVIDKAASSGEGLQSHPC